MTEDHIMLQEWLPSRDNVVFLIDAQAAMLEEAGLKDTPVSITQYPGHLHTSSSLKQSDSARKLRCSLSLAVPAKHWYCAVLPCGI